MYIHFIIFNHLFSVIVILTYRNMHSNQIKNTFTSNNIKCYSYFNNITCAEEHSLLNNVSIYPNTILLATINNIAPKFANLII